MTDMDLVKRLLHSVREHDAEQREAGGPSSGCHVEFCHELDAAFAALGRIAALMKEAAIEIRSDAMDIKESHTVRGEWSCTEAVALSEYQRLHALATKIWDSARVEDMP